MPTGSSPRLLGKNGGTNARFAWQVNAGAAPSEVAPATNTPPCRPRQADGARMCDSDANSVTGGLVRMTKLDGLFSIVALRDEVGLERLAEINDFTAGSHWRRRRLAPFVGSAQTLDTAKRT